MVTVRRIADTCRTRLPPRVWAHGGMVQRFIDMTMTVSVTPIESGWSVRREPGGETLVFRSGGRAEAAARQVAEAARQSGISAEVFIHTRDGACVGRLNYEP